MTDYTNSEYELRWPKALFVQEADRATEPNAALILVQDVFVNGEELTRESWDAVTLLEDLVAHVHDLPERAPARPYWSERISGLEPKTLDFHDVAASFVELIGCLDRRGYFERVFGADCVDNPRPGTDPALELKRRLGRDDLWPLQRNVASWNRDTLFDLIEVFHDIAARPTDGTYHSFAGCGWDYSRYSSKAGQALYRWEVNRILDRSDIGYRLAEAGEDIGRMVIVAGDARDDLVGQMLARGGPSQGRVDHAIAQFRSRGATRDEKRAAVRSLADVLESRRQLLKAHLLKKDEAALFQVANEFDIRHHRADQRADYDEAYLDWLFWWYLATVGLLDRLLARQGHSSA